MTSSSKAKGDRAERAVVAAMLNAGWRWVERRPAGAAVDVGDVTGLGLPLVVEVRDRAEPRHAEWAREAAAKAAAAWPGDPDALGVTWIKARGRASAADWTVSCTGSTFLRLLMAWANSVDDQGPRPSRDAAKVESLNALAVRRRLALNAAKADNLRLAAANRTLIGRIHDLETERAASIPDPTPGYREA